MKCRCRKCRFALEVDLLSAQNEDSGSVSVTGSVCAAFNNVQSESSVLYLAEENYPEWISQKIQEACWTKGRLCCPKCGGRLGSFDFLKIHTCVCGQHPLPAVHLLKDRVDEVVLRTPDNIVRPRVQRRLSDQVIQASCPMSENNVMVSCDKVSSQHSNRHENLNTICDNTSDTCDKVTRECKCENCMHGDRSVKEYALNNDCTLPKEISCYCSDRLSELGELNFMTEPGDQTSLDVKELFRDGGASTDGLQSTAVFDGESAIDLSSNSDKYNNDRSKLSTAVIDSDNEVDVSEQDQEVRQQADVDVTLSDDVHSTDDANPFNVLMADSNDQPLEQVDDQSREDGGQEMEDVPEVEIPGELTCSVCLELFYRPHTCHPCEHTFCEPCLRAICRQVPVNTPCPLCRKPINVCAINRGLMEQIGDQFMAEYLRRKQELQRWKKTKRFYPLPGQETNRHWIQRELLRDGNAGGPFSFVYRMEQTIMTCLNDILVRFAWIILVFLMHNVIFRISEWVSFSMYLRNTYHFNDFLKGMVMKLLKFGIIHVVRRCFGLTFDRRDILGYFVVYAGLTMVFMYDSMTWTQFMYSMVILGSLFTT